MAAMVSPAIGESARVANSDALLRVEDLCTHFPVKSSGLGRGGTVKAVDGVTFHVKRGCTLGLVGESGCGKSTLARTILRLIPATSGSVWFEDRDVYALSTAELRTLRREMQIVFQDPIGSLNPRMNVETIVGEALSVHGLARSRHARRARVADLLRRVGLSPDDSWRYPHEFSGGQRQRIGIARALALNPKLVICDEPVSALDVSIQSQILNLLADLQEEFGLSYLFIAHDLAVVRHVSDEIAVMYLGKIVEQASADELFSDPRHPYTQALLAAVPVPDPSVRRARVPVPGEPPNPLDPPTGCAFHPRCRWGEARCRQEVPVLKPHEGLAAGHIAACHRVEQEGPAQG
jgi:oligopeptide transport system ATP-binding protein